MINTSDVCAAVAQFTEFIPTMREPIWYSHKTIEMKRRGAARAEPWAKEAGIYAFYLGNGELRYIGRALSSVGLAARVPDHLREKCRGNPEWDVVLDDQDATVDVCVIAPQDAVWVPSLELFLCERFQGLVNRRRS